MGDAEDVDVEVDVFLGESSLTTGAVLALRDAFSISVGSLREFDLDSRWFGVVELLFMLLLAELLLKPGELPGEGAIPNIKYVPINDGFGVPGVVAVLFTFALPLFSFSAIAING